MAQKKKSPVGMILMILALVFLLVCGLGGFALYQFFSGAVKMGTSVISCSLNFELAQKAALAYAKENGDKLPTADKWQEQIAPYYTKLKSSVLAKNPEFKDMPFFNFEPNDIKEPLDCSFGEPTTGVTFNSDLSGKKLADIKEPETTPLFFETETIAINSAAAFKERAANTGPKIMGSARNWLIWNVKQDKNPFDSNSSQFNFEIKMEDALGAKAEPAASPEKP